MKNSLAILLKRIETGLLDSKIESNPFPHISFNISLTDCSADDLLKLTSRNPADQYEPYGRLNLSFAELDEYIQDIIDSIGYFLISKLNIKLPKLDSKHRYISLRKHINLWLDSSDLLIQDIHLDFIKCESENWDIKSITEKTQTVISMHIYLPEDDNHSDLGTSLYLVPNDVPRILPDSPIEIPTLIPSKFEDKCIKAKQIAYIPGNVFIHSSDKNTWHQAPTVPAGYIRKSLMIRWEYNAFNLINI